MPRQQSVEFVTGQLVMSVQSLRQEEEALQELGQVCHDPHERARIAQDIDLLEEEEDAILDYLAGSLRQHQQLHDMWALRTLREEPTHGEMRRVGSRRNGETARVRAARLQVGA